MEAHRHNENRTRWVVLITFITMVVEITFGLTTRSMALLADGIHMGSHVLAIGLSWVAYVFIRKVQSGNTHSMDNENLLSLSGFTSGLLLLIFAFVIMVGAVKRFIAPIEVHYSEAILVAVIGLVINIACAMLLHQHEEHSDHNIKAAYIHVLADALTSVAAIVGLLAARYFNAPFIDPLVAIISSLVIIRWSVGLLSDTGKSLIGFK